MTNGLDLARLMAWLSPVFPTGSFAYSSGLEAAVTNGIVANQSEFQDWLVSLILFGRLRNDTIFLVSGQSACNDAEPLREVNQLALASAGSSELHFESVAQGRAFVDALTGWAETNEIDFPDQPALPVAVGAACGVANIEPRLAVIGYLHAFLANQLQIAIRLSVLGQTGAAQILAGLEQHIIDLAEATEQATIDNLGSAALAADILSMGHESQHGRMFRS